MVSFKCIEAPYFSSCGHDARTGAVVHHTRRDLLQDKVSTPPVAKNPLSGGSSATEKTQPRFVTGVEPKVNMARKPEFNLWTAVSSGVSLNAYG